MKKSILIGSLALAAIGVAVIAYGASAFQGRSGQYGSNYTPERHEAMLKAFESGNYNSWKELMGNRGAATRVTEQNFNRFTEMHKLMLEGKYDEANAIRTELGLGQGRGNGIMSQKRGQNRAGNFIDANGDGKCDRI